MTRSMYSRREFLGLSASAAALLGLTGCAGLGYQPFGRKGRLVPPGEKVRVAQVGFAGKGYSDIRALKDENVVALCDVDWSLPKVQETFNEFPKAKRFKDFREMLLTMGDEIDAVGVATPDHMHFLPAYKAILMGKHVYVQKPLTHTIWEANTLREAARQHGVCTQMGNQGHAGEGTRLMREWVQAGVIGPVRKADIWTDRAGKRWPQGVPAPTDKQEAPKDLAWDLFVGGAPYRPYNNLYHPFKWRGWWDFGTGALGDMACHLMDASFWALDLHLALDADTPIAIEAKTSELNKDSYPDWSIITFEFPARGKMPPVTFTWYDGGKLPERPKELEADRKMSKGGQILYGENGVIMDTSDYCESPRLIPESAMKAARSKLPEKTIPRIPEGNPHLEWIRAIKGGPAAGSNFDYSARMAAMVLLGNIAIRAQKKIFWDGRRKRVTNWEEGNQYVNLAYREGWEPMTIASQAKG